jgi:hypothetical protein
LIDASEAVFSDSVEDACLSTDTLAARHSVADARCALVVCEPLRRLLSWTLTFYARRHGIDVRTFVNAQQARTWLTNPTDFPRRAAGNTWPAVAEPPSGPPRSSISGR